MKAMMNSLKKNGEDITRLLLAKKKTMIIREMRNNTFPIILIRLLTI